MLGEVVGKWRLELQEKIQLESKGNGLIGENL
jgi:hypothetical protein